MEAPFTPFSGLTSLEWIGSMGQILTRLDDLIPAPASGVVFAPPGDDADADLVVLVDAPFTMRLRLHLAEQTICNVFVENPASLVAAIGAGTSPRCVRILSEGAIVSDETGALARFAAHASEARRAPRPLPVLERMRAAGGPAELLARLERRQSETVVAQLIYAELLGALLRARLAAAGSWATDVPIAFDACREVDPGLAGWVAVNARRPFAEELLPAIRTRVAAVLELLGAQEDIASGPELTVPPVLVRPN